LHANHCRFQVPLRARKIEGSQLKAELSQLAGTALLWKAIQLGGLKGLFLIRLLVLARLLAPDDFGLLAIALTAAGFLLIITDFGILPALVQRTDIDEQHYNAAWTLGFIRGLVVTGVLVLGAPIIATMFNEPRAINIIRGLAIATLLEQMASIKLADLTRRLEFRSLAFTGITKALADTMIAISLAPLLGVWALVVGALGGSAAYTFISYIVAPHRPRLFLDRETVRILIRYGRWIFLTGLIAVAGAAALRALISHQLGTVELGIYFLAGRLAFLPAEIAKEVVGSVAFPLYARLKSDIHQVTQAFRAIFIGMVAILMPICALIIFLAPSLIENLLGSKWAGTVPIIQLLAIASIICPIGESTVSLVQGLGYPYKITVLEAVQSLLAILCALVFIGDYGLIGVALAWLIGTGVSQIVSIAFARQTLYQPFQRLGAPFAAIFCVSLTGAVTALGIDRLLQGIIGLCAAGLTGAAIMGGLSWYLDRRFEFGLGRNLVRAFPPLARLIDLSPAKT
jgi:lipopolysaccharide exporter